ncbi:hypothetical protein F2Q68_00039701, partial [Brassica cretica]
APEIDISELESLFSAASDTTAKKSTGRRSSISKPEKVQLVDLRRANNCEIMLTKIKIPLPDMLSAVLALDSSVLDIDQVENLIKFCPTKEEMELLRNYTGGKEMLGKCEQFFLELMKVPRIEAKLRVFGFKITFASQAEDLKSCLTTINAATKEVKESAKLRQIMQTILTLGNALNQGTARAFLESYRHNTTDMKGKTVLVFNKPVSKEGLAAVILAQSVPDESYPYILTSYEHGADILQYIRTTRSPTVRISAATTLTGPPAAAKVVAFSSRGPNSVSPAILKPDIAAPGVNILAALSPLDPDSHKGFGLLSGTSMSTPVVSGITALLKCLHPDWSPAAIRSALVTTAWRTSKSGEPIFAEGSNKKLADPFDYGGGLVNPESAADPGLVYDMGIKDYISYMCSAGYNDTSISRVLGKKTNCPSPGASILDINLPSITIPNLDQEVILTRTLTNVGPNNSVYKAVIESPLGVTLTVSPTTLVFGSGEVLSYAVTAKTSHKVSTGYFFGSLTWTDSVHDVRIPVSVQTTIMS